MENGPMTNLCSSVLGSSLRLGEFALGLPAVCHDNTLHVRRLHTGRHRRGGMVLATHHRSAFIVLRSNSLHHIRRRRRSVIVA
jgi:hypothetical protein